MTLDDRELAKKVHLRLIDFYGYPEWRNPLPPLDELISTILSQNTNDLNRDRAYQNLRTQFISWEDVRDADESAVVNSIRVAGLGNQKGPRIQRVLKQITEEQGDLDLGFLEGLQVDEAREWLLRFKGVGPKTAAIVLLFSLGKPDFPVDTHIYRVSGRLGIRPNKMTADQAHVHLRDLFEEEMYYPVHLNLIRLGREICHPRNPACQHCPLLDICGYYKEVIAYQA
jgi:endonuclease-3